jgi:hypothetical protein
MWYLSPRTMRALLLLALGSLLSSACDKSGPLADIDASSPWPLARSAASASASALAAASADAGRVMPPRPVPTSSPTVRITMPMETQLQAIQYMAAMQAPQPSDAPADLTYAKQIADGLASLGKTEVSSGRLIDVRVAKGCNATLPRESIASHTGASLTTLLAHGVLVVRCTDHELQCLQSTRDADDVLCVHR